MKGRGFLNVFIHWPEGILYSKAEGLNEEDSMACQNTDKPHISYVASHHDTFVPVDNVTEVMKLGSMSILESYMGDKYHTQIMTGLADANTCNCDPTSGVVCNKQDASSPHECILHEYLPFYVISVAQKGDYMVHPCERERMERILNGTDDPMYDLVHELRYNPHVGIGSELKEAKNDFNKRIKNTHDV